MAASDPAIDGREIVSDAAAAAEVATGEPTAGGSRRSVLFLAGSLAGGNLVAMAMRLVGGIMLGRLIAPDTLGLFAGIALVLGYSWIAQMGVLNGVNRELPYHIGRGDVARAHDLAAAGQAWALAAGGVVSVCLLAVAAWQLAQGELEQAAGWANGWARAGSLSNLRHLIIIGAPIYFVGQIYGFWTGVINATLVLHFTGNYGMGLYAMVALSITAMEVIPAALAQVLYPRMAEDYGAGRDIRHLVRISIKPMLATFAGLAVVAAVGWFLAEPVVQFVVPQYVAAVPAIQWALLLPLVSCFLPLESVFNVVRRQDMYLDRPRLRNRHVRPSPC